MALKFRFKKKDVVVKGEEEKNKFKVLEGVTAVNPISLHLKNEIQSDSLSDKKLACYHRINEFYQNNSLSLFNMMKGLLEIVCQGVEAEGGSLWIIEEDLLHLKVAHGPGASQLKGLSLKIGEGIVGWSAENKKSAIVYDTSTDQRFFNKKKSNTKSLISCPLIYANEVVGVIQTVNKINVSESFSDSDKFFLEDLATTVAMHIKTRRTLKKQDGLLKRMQTFSELHELFSSTMDIDKLLPLVLQKAIHLVGAEVGSVWLVEDSKEGYVCQYAHGPTKNMVEGVKLKKGTGIIGSVIESKEAHIIEDCSLDDHFSRAVDQKTNFISKSMICSPFIVKGECIGAIQILNKAGAAPLFNEEDLELLNLFAGSSAMYIKNARLFASEKKAKDLTALIDIGREITSTLDLDSVLVSLVNLSGELIPFDLMAVSTMKMKRDDCVLLRAISGEKEIDFDNKEQKNIDIIHNQFLKLEMDELYVDNREAYEFVSDHEFVKKYMEDHELKSIWIKLLKDDQGPVGIIHIESDDSGLVTSNTEEILGILTTQTTVSLRNVDLYHSIPSGQYFTNLKDELIAKLYNIKDWGLKKILKLVGGLITASLLITIVKVPYNVNTSVQIIPLTNTYYSFSNGVVKNVFVKEGEFVEKGKILAEIDVTDSVIELQQKESTREKTRVEMLKLKNERKIAEYKIKEKELLSLIHEMTILEKKIDSSIIRAKEEGIVISENLHELMGTPVTYGKEIIKVASKEKMLAQFEVPQENIIHVKSDQSVKFKVFGHPTVSFEDFKLNSVGGEATQLLETDPTTYYLARAIITTKDGDASILRPGMTGRGKIYTGSRVIGKIILDKIHQLLVMTVF